MEQNLSVELKIELALIPTLGRFSGACGKIECRKIFGNEFKRSLDPQYSDYRNIIPTTQFRPMGFGATVHRNSIPPNAPWRSEGSNKPPLLDAQILSIRRLALYPP